MTNAGAACTPNVTPQATRGARQVKLALAVMLLFFAALAIPCLIWPLLPHPDERRYSIAAALMLEGQNWLVPISETGDIRLKKPPLTYWYLLPGFALFGETLASAKALFLASGLGIISLSFAMARSLGASPLAALVAPATVAGHGVFFTTSTQHIPDMPLVLGLSVALLGAIRVLRDSPSNWWDWAALWLGLAWAVLAKGLLPLLLAVLVLVMLGWPHRGREPLDARIPRAAIGWGSVATLISAAWFVWIGVNYPDELMREFVRDQVTGKAGFNPWQVLAGLRKTVTDLVLPALPVVFALIFALWHRPLTTSADRSSRRAEYMLWLWCGLVVILFAFSTQLYERYILPALPAFAALLALWASRVNLDALSHGARLSVRIWLWLPVLVALLAALIAWRFDAPVLALLSMGTTFLTAALLWRAAAQLPAALVALALLVPLIEVARLPIFGTIIQPTAGQIAYEIEAFSPKTEQRLVFDDPKLVDEIGLITGGLTRLHFQNSYDSNQHTEVATIYFLNPDHLEPLREEGFTITEYPILRDLELTLPEIVAAFKQGQRTRLARDHGETLFVARRTSRSDRE